MYPNTKHKLSGGSNKQQDAASFEFYGLLKTSWQYQGKLFFEQSTLHGVRYIAENGRPVIEKLMWFVCVLIGAISTTVIISSLWEKFQTNPTITGLDTDFHNWDVPFPAITICQSVPSNESIIDEYINRHMAEEKNVDEVKHFLTKLTQLSFVNLHEVKALTQSKYLPENADLKKFVFSLMNPCDTIFSSCVWKAEAYNCCSGFFPVFTEIGFCYTFNSRLYEKSTPWSDEPLPDFTMRYIKETDAKWSLKFYTYEASDDYNISVYIHNSDEVPSLGVKAQLVWDYKVDRMLFSLKQTYTTEDARQLSIKQRHCVYDDEIKLKIDNIYSYSACNQQCRLEAAISSCGCVPHFYPNQFQSKYKNCELTELKCIADNLDKIGNSVDKCNCQLGCSNTVYEVEKLNENSGDSEMIGLEAEFVSWPMVRYKREVLFGWVDLLVSFGGIAGLFLGFSLLSGVELIYYFTIRACCMVNKEKDELKQIQYESRKHKRTDYDLALVPYCFRKPRLGQGRNLMLRRLKAKINFPSKLGETLGRPKTKPIVVAPYGIEFTN